MELWLSFPNKFSLPTSPPIELVDGAGDKASGLDVFHFCFFFFSLVFVAWGFLKKDFCDMLQSFIRVN